MLCFFNKSRENLANLEEIRELINCMGLKTQKLHSSVQKDPETIDDPSRTLVL